MWWLKEMSLKIVFCCCSFVRFDGNGMDSEGRESQ